MEHIAKPVLIIYKVIVEGDLRKFENQSNDSATGGGARDLRFNPLSVFRPIFIRMFPKEIKKDQYEAIFHWSHYPPTHTIIHTTTANVRKEVRIACIRECLHNFPVNAGDAIFLLVMDSNGEVWPYFTSEQSLRNDDWDPLVSSEILRGLAAKRNTKTTAAGYLDLENNVYYTNGD